MIGSIHTIKCHRDDDNLVLDSWERSSFSYVESSFSDWDYTVVKTDNAGTVNDAFTVKFLFTDGNEPATSSSRLDMLTWARSAVAEAVDSDIAGLSKIA